MPAEKRSAESYPEELLRALPKDRDADPTGERLAKLLADVAGKRVPASSFSRMCILGSLQAKIACGYFAFWLRSRFSNAKEKSRLRNEAHIAAALKLLGTMGYLRGAVMKVGQMLGNLPEMVPEEFAEVLASLHFEAPPMHYALVREVFLDEFGREPEEVFASFDREAFAAASLGQVHQARLHSGEDVAVKIQYPDMARTIRADLRNLRLLLQPMRLSSDWPHLPDKIEDLEQMLLGETDYLQEARFGSEIRTLFTAADQVVVPRVYEQFSTTRVLTTEYLPGRHLDAFLATEPSQELRDHFTHLLTAATVRLLYRKHWLLADPHPGNFIFMDDGRLGLIDFGCTRVMSEEEWRLQREIEDAALAGDDRRIDQAVAKACLYDSPEEMEPERLEVVGRGARWQLEPWQTEGLFDFGDREFFRRGVDAFMEISRKRYTRGAPLYLWTNRFVLGARAIVYRLQGRCNFRSIYEEESSS